LGFKKIQTKVIGKNKRKKCKFQKAQNWHSFLPGTFSINIFGGHFNEFGITLEFSVDNPLLFWFKKLFAILAHFEYFECMCSNDAILYLVKYKNFRISPKKYTIDAPSPDDCVGASN
jgi:hypothetical protein